MSASMSPAHWMPVRVSSDSPGESAAHEATHDEAATEGAVAPPAAASIASATEHEGKRPRPRPHQRRRHTHRQTAEVPTHPRVDASGPDTAVRLHRRDVPQPVTRRIAPPPRPAAPPAPPESSPHLLLSDHDAAAEASARSRSVSASRCNSSGSSSHSSPAARTLHGGSGGTAGWTPWPPLASDVQNGEGMSGAVPPPSQQASEGSLTPASIQSTRAPVHRWRTEVDGADCVWGGEGAVDDKDKDEDRTAPVLVEAAAAAVGPRAPNSGTPRASTAPPVPLPSSVLIAPTAAPPPVIFPQRMVGSPHGIQLRTPHFAQRPSASPAPQPSQPPPPPRKAAPPPPQFAPLASPPETALLCGGPSGTPVQGKRDDFGDQRSMLQPPQSPQSSTMTTTNGLSARTLQSSGSPATTSPVFTAAFACSSADDLITSPVTTTSGPSGSAFEPPQQQQPQQRGGIPPPPPHAASRAAAPAAHHHRLSPLSLQPRTPQQQPPPPPPPPLPATASPTLQAGGGGSATQRPPRFSVADNSDRDRPERPGYLRLTSPCAAVPSSGGPRRPSASSHLLSPLSAFEPQDGSLTHSLPTFPLLSPRIGSGGGGGSGGSRTPTPHVPELDFSGISDGPRVRDGAVMDAPWWSSARDASSGGAMPSPYLSATAFSSAGHRPHYGGGSSSSINAYSGYDEDDEDSEDEFAEFHPDVRKARELAQLQQQQQKSQSDRGRTPLDAHAPRHLHRAARVSRDAQGASEADSRRSSSDEDYIVPGYNDHVTRSRASAASNRENLAGYYRGNQSRAAAGATGSSVYAGRSLKKDLSRGFLRGAGGRSGAGGLHRGARVGASAASWVHAVRRFLSVAGTYLFRFAAIYISSWLILRTRSAMTS